MLKLGEEQEIQTPDGRRWRLSRLELRHVRAFREWVETRIGDPFQVVERFLGKLDDSQLMPLLKEAEQVKHQLRAFSMGCPLAIEHLGTEEGVTYLVSLLLARHHHPVVEEDAWEVALEVDRRRAEVLERAQGKLPPNAEAPAPEVAAAGLQELTIGRSTAG